MFSSQKSCLHVEVELWPENFPETDFWRGKEGGIIELKFPGPRPVKVEGVLLGLRWGSLQRSMGEKSLASGCGFSLV